MIEITMKVFPSSGPVVERTLAKIKIENTMEGDPDVGSYRADITVDHGDSYTVFTRYISGFPRKKYNVLGLLKLVLEQITEEEMDLDATSAPADLARGLNRASTALSSLLGKMHNH